jgi:hypothetical protein
VIVFGGALLGMCVTLPESHLRDEIKDVIRLSAGLIGTISGLVLALLISSAKSSYDASNTQIKQITSNIIYLDILLEQYGPETNTLRVALRDTVPRMVDRIWNERINGNKSEPFVATTEAVALIERIQELKPDSEAKRDLQARMLSVVANSQQIRFDLFAHAHDSISTPFLVILIFWLTIIFASFGLFSRPNPIVIVTFFVGALSVSGAVFLILEMDRPFAGLLQISREPLMHTLPPLAL